MFVMALKALIANVVSGQLAVGPERLATLLRNLNAAIDRLAPVTFSSYDIQGRG